MVDEQPAEQRPGDAGEHEHHLDVALVAAALARLDELGDDRHRERHQPARAEALQGAERDQLAQRLRGPAQRRPGQEHRNRRLEERLAAVEVAHPAPQRHGDRRGEQVGGDDPRELVDAAEVPDDRREGGGDDRLVERRQEHRQEQPGEDGFEVVT